MKRHALVRTTTMNPESRPDSRRRAVLGAAIGALLPLGKLRAQAYPAKTVRFVIPYAAGGGTDLLMRILQAPLEADLGQSILIDNRSGASGAIAAKDVARAAPDGYTFLVSNNGPSVILPLLQQVGYDPVKDFTPVTTIAVAPIVLIANPSVPATDVASFIAWARQQSNGVSYATAGAGSIGHLSAELFAQMAKLKLTHIPYRGQAPTTNAILAGETSIAFTSSSDAMLAHIKAGKIRLLGIGSEQASPLVPGGEPIAKTLPGYKADFWQGVIAPAKTPQAVVDRIAGAFGRILGTPEFQAKYVRLSYAASTNTPPRFAQMIEAEVREWKGLIAERHIKIES